MEHHFSENLETRKGVISNLHCFLNRHLDTGFKTKWSGLWVPPYKFLDYYAIKINGEWLGPETVEATEYGDKIIHHHTTSSLNITERIKAPETAPGIEIELEIENRTDKPKAVKTGVELGVDIRSKDTDIDRTEYRTDKGPGRLSIHRNNLKLLFTSETEFTVDREPYLKEHYPGEKQECLIPGEISFRSEIKEQASISFELSTPDGSFGGLEKTDQVLEHDELGYRFECALDSLRNMVYDRNETIGLLAGHPWFQSYWARDSFWSTLGLIDAGHFELAEDILTAFAKRDLPDKIVIDGDDRREPKQYDTEPLFIIAADKLARHYMINDKIEEAMEDAVEGLELENKLVKNDPCGTWMDTRERPEAVEIQSLWIEALKIMDDERSEELREGLEEFMQEEYMLDGIEREWRTINPAVPLMLGHVDDEKAEKYLETINGEFNSRFGARTVSMTDPGYSSSGYHEGSVWGLTTCWAAAANMEYGKTVEGRNLLENFTMFSERDQPGALPENIDAETGEVLGCSEQAWSAGMAVHVIDSYLLGLKVEDGKLFVRPPENISCRRLNKKVKDTSVDLEFRNGDVKVLNDPEIEVIIE